MGKIFHDFHDFHDFARAETKSSAPCSHLQDLLYLRALQPQAIQRSARAQFAPQAVVQRCGTAPLIEVAVRTQPARNDIENVCMAWLVTAACGEGTEV